jgi:hypothetical protein
MSDKTSSSKRLLIIAGAQGSGNHLFARLFTLHHKVKGWQALLEQYWVPSDEEPFAKVFVNPSELNAELLEEYTLMNVSYPFIYNGEKVYPKIKEVADRAIALGAKVQIGIIVRDHNINRMQQQRVRGYVAFDEARSYFRHLDSEKYDIHFISHESLFAYPNMYMRYLGQQLDFPVDWKNASSHIDVAPNSKYVKYVEEHWLDEQVHAGLRTKSERGIDN